jgi:hypothetical protein
MTHVLISQVCVGEKLLRRRPAHGSHRYRWRNVLACPSRHAIVPQVMKNKVADTGAFARPVESAFDHGLGNRLPRFLSAFGPARLIRREQIRNLELSLRSDVSKYSDNQMDDPGAELAKITQRNLEICPHLSYAQAKRLAILENPRLGERYMGGAVAYDRVGEVQQFFAEAAQLTKRHDMSPNVIISNIVTGLPRLADNSIDIAAAVQAVNSFGGDTLQRAAQEELEKLVRTQVAIDGIPGSEAMRPEMMRGVGEKVRKKYPGLAAAANGQPISEQGLRELCWPLFNK